MSEPMDKYKLTDIQYDKLISIWTFSCVTSNPKIAYESLVYRYDFQTIDEAKNLVKTFKEMFLPGIITSELESIKAQFQTENAKDDKVNDLPAWLINKGDAATREPIIQALDKDSFFSSQVRFSDTIPPSSVEVLKWGIEHIERFRKEKKEKQEKRKKDIKEMWLPVASVVLSLFAVSIAGLVPYWTAGKQEKLQADLINSQKELQKAHIDHEKILKYSELQVSSKQAGYSIFMKYLDDSYNNAAKNDSEALMNSLYQAELAYYDLEQFLKVQTNLWKNFKEKTLGCDNLKTCEVKPKIENYKNNFVANKDIIKDEMFKELFK